MDFYEKYICEKAKRKREAFGKMFFPRDPVLFMDLSSEENANEFKDLLAGLDSINLKTVVVTEDENFLPPSKNMLCVPPREKEKSLRAADFALIFGGERREWQETVEAGCVPISKLDGDSTVDYNPLQEKGNGFYFKNSTKWEIFASIVRALETYKFPFDWENLVREILKKPHAGICKVQ